MPKLYKGINPKQFNTGEDLSYAEPIESPPMFDETGVTASTRRGVSPIDERTPENVSPDDKSYEVKGNPFTPSERLSPIEEDNPPVVMSDDERIAKKRELDMSALTPPPAYELPKIPLGLNIFMLTMDAFTGKANWLNFLLNDRKQAEAGIAKKNSDSLNTFIRNQPIREQQIKVGKMAVDRQYYSGQRILKGYGMQMGEEERRLKQERFMIGKAISENEIKLQAVEFALKKPPPGTDVEGLKMQQKALLGYIKHDTERLRANGYAFIGAEMAKAESDQTAPPKENLPTQEEGNLRFLSE